MFDKYQNRNSSVELLRIVFMTMIVTIHAFGHGSGLNYDYIYSLGNEWNTALHLGIFSLGKCGVTGFMFISGYYGIKLKWEKLGSLVVMLGFYLLCFSLIAEQSIISTLRSLVHPWDIWWYVSSYVVIVLLSPIINKGIESINKKQFRNIVLALLFYEYVGQALYAANSHDTVFLLTVFLVARFVKIYLTPPPEKSNLYCLASYRIIAFIMLISLCVIPIVLVKIGFGNLNVFFITNNNILILAFVALLVVIVERVKFKNKFINYIATSTLAVYVITDSFFVQKPLDTWLLHEVLNQWFGYGCILFTVVSCLCIDKFREILFELFKILCLNVKSITRK